MTTRHAFFLALGTLGFLTFSVTLRLVLRWRRKLDLPDPPEDD